jgi:hypothetical protein
VAGAPFLCQDWSFQTFSHLLRPSFNAAFFRQSQSLPLLGITI